MKFQTKEWLKAANDDLIVMQEILNNEYVTHMVAFHSQQCVEKTFKAILEEFEDRVIKVHNLMVLLGKAKSHISLQVDESVIDVLDTLYTDARYPGEIGLLPNGKPTLDDAEKFYLFAQSVHEKITNTLIKISGEDT